MAEANPFAVEADSADALLVGLENGDLSSGVYEGGFKTWECALDLASLLLGPMSRLPLDPHVGQDWEIIELGAGSAIPSLAILGAFLRQRATGGKSQGRGSLRVTLCDYNVDVLRLATAPNVFLNYIFVVGSASSSPSSSPQKAGEDEGDVDLEEIGAEALVADTVKSLLAHNVTMNFISGAWGSDFVDLVTSHPDSLSATSSPPSSGPSNLLILASETIYSPASTRNFSRTIVALLRTHQQRHHTTNTGTRTAKAWVAAKKVYFGVGGGVDEFTRELELLGGKSIVIFETKDTGVGRVVLEITVEE
jgi:protein-histidine N-methyltransferase